jgi:hypothetical protein
MTTLVSPSPSSLNDDSEVGLPPGQTQRRGAAEHEAVVATQNKFFVTLFYHGPECIMCASASETRDAARPGQGHRRSEAIAA